MIRIKEELTEEKKKQREKIREFDELQISYQRTGLPPQLAGWVGYIFCAVTAMCPAQAYFSEKDSIWSLLLLSYLWTVLGAQYFMAPYLQFREKKKTVTVLQKIIYLPVDIREIKIVWLGYLAVYIRKLFLLALVVQLLVSLLVYHAITFWNLLLVVCIAGLPLLINGLMIWYSHYPRK